MIQWFRFRKLPCPLARTLGPFKFLPLCIHGRRGRRASDSSIGSSSIFEPHVLENCLFLSPYFLSEQKRTKTKTEAVGHRRPFRRGRSLRNAYGERNTTTNRQLGIRSDSPSRVASAPRECTPLSPAGELLREDRGEAGSLCVHQLGLNELDRTSQGKRRFLRDIWRRWGMPRREEKKGGEKERGKERRISVPPARSVGSPRAGTLFKSPSRGCSGFLRLAPVSCAGLRRPRARIKGCRRKRPGERKCLSVDIHLRAPLASGGVHEAKALLTSRAVHFSPVLKRCPPLSTRNSAPRVNINSTRDTALRRLSKREAFLGVQ